MELTTLRVLVTLLSFIVFVAIALWAWRNRNSAQFKEAQELPFKQD